MEWWGAETKLKQINKWASGEEMEARTTEKYLEKFDYEWGGERKEIKRYNRLREMGFFFLYGIKF